MIFVCSLTTTFGDTAFNKTFLNEPCLLFQKMQIITKDEIRLRKEELKEKILDGEIFIHPTDTIYGIGCDATNSKAVKKIREIKQRPDTPFSIMAPSKEWIRENCIITKEAEKWLDKLPGPYTLILKTKDKPVASEVAPGLESLGVRIPNHWITKLINWIGVPIITTSVNITDEPYMTSTEDLEDSIQTQMDFCLYEGEKQGNPSKIIHLDDGERVVER